LKRVIIVGYILILEVAPRLTDAVARLMSNSSVSTEAAHQQR